MKLFSVAHRPSIYQHLENRACRNCKTRRTTLQQLSRKRGKGSQVRKRMQAANNDNPTAEPKTPTKSQERCVVCAVQSGFPGTTCAQVEERAHGAAGELPPADGAAGAGAVTAERLREELFIECRVIVGSTLVLTSAGVPCGWSCAQCPEFAMPLVRWVIFIATPYGK